MRICTLKATGKLIEMQSAATKGTLIKNALSAGYEEVDIEEREITEAEWADPAAPWRRPTDSQLEASAESQRQARFAEYDTAIMRLKRAERMGDPTATASIAQWDEYAVALQVLNDSAGWFRDTVWPIKPEV